MIRTLLCIVLSALSLAVAAEPVVLFDFEDAAQLDRLAPNTKASRSSEWASEGASSLKIEFPAHVPGQTPDYPQVACWEANIPVRNWRPYRFYSVDVHVPEDDTYLGVIVQRSKERRDRMDRRYTLAKGTFRLWINIENAVARAGDMDSVADVFELEFFQSKPTKASILYLDNIRLTTSYDSTEDTAASAWVDTVEQLAEIPPPEASEGPGLDRIVTVNPSPLDVRAERIAALNRLAKEVRGRAATETIAQTIDAHFADYAYGVMSAPIEDHIFFQGQGVNDTWDCSLTLEVLRGEVRSKQIVVFPRPGESLEAIRVEMSELHGPDGAVIAAERLSVEMVGYVYLAESVMNRFKDFTGFGWYPDPILALEQPFDIKAPRLVQPLLWTIRTPRDVAPGLYSGSVTVAPAGRKPYALEVTVCVHEAVMPVACQLPHLIHCGLEALFPDFRLNPNNSELGDIYRWGSAVDPAQIEAFVEKGLNRFNLHRVSQFNVANRCGERGEEQGAQSFVHFIAGIYTDDAMKELSQRQLTDKAVFYGFDEVDVENPLWRGRIERVFGGLKDRYGKYGIKTATTARPWSSPGAWDLPVDIWIPLLREYDPVLARQARERGIEVWWYSINWEIFNGPLWSKALFWASYANEVDGWLYYHLSDWCNREQHLADGNPLTSWSPQSEGTRGSYGTGAVVYWDRDGNPRPSLRLVNLREGLFDYDALRMLQDRIDDFRSAHPSPSPKEDVLLERASEVVDVPWRGTLVDYVLDPSLEDAAQIERSISRSRADALRYLDALGATPPAAPVTGEQEDMRAARKKAAQRTRRIIFNNDGGDVLVHAKEKDIDALLACRTTGLVGTHCDSLFYSTSRGSFGSFSHPTSVGDTFTSTESRYKDNLLQWLLDQGTDPIKLMTAFGHEHGLEVFWSMRINDTHDSWGYEWGDLITSSIKKQHPEWLVSSKENPSKIGGYLAADFTHPEIRDYTFRFVQEVCQIYDVDGVEIDFFRHPVYFKRHAWSQDVGAEERAMMTDLMRRIRTMADAEGRKRGRPILIAARVPDSADWCNAIGIDLVRWLDEDLIDIMNVTGYFRLNPWETSVDLAHGYGVPVYACLSETRMKDKEAKAIRSSIEGFRGRAMNAWTAGVDGLYLFNAFDPGHPLWSELGDPATLAKRTKVYTTGVRDVDAVPKWLVGGERFLNRDPVSPRRPRKLAAGKPTMVELRIGEDPVETGAKVALGLRLEGPSLKLAVRVNDEAPGTPAHKGIWLEYPVPASLIREGANQIEITAEDGDLLLYDLVVWARQGGQQAE